jgi:hypothetical protein
MTGEPPADADVQTSTDARKDAYVQIPHALADDPVYASLYGNDETLAAFVRMKLAADRAWPSSPTVPRRLSEEQLRMMLDSGLVTLCPGDRFRVPSTDELRRKRSEAGKTGGLASGKSRERG